MTVRAKFKCTEKRQHEVGYRILFCAVTSGSKENEVFFKWTPDARLEIGTINSDAAAQFTPGNEYYLDISACE